MDAEIFFFRRLCRQLFVPDIDMFASRLNNQVEKFVSWFIEPGSFHNDALRCPGTFKPYIFPPFSLLGKVINKIVQIDR